MRFYSQFVGNTFSNIIFAENSGTNLESLQSVAKERGIENSIEFISIKNNQFPPSYGRGYGEFKLVDGAMENFNAIKYSQNNDIVVWKCTGRYIVKNIKLIADWAPIDFDIYCHKRNYPYRLCELFLMAWNHRGYKLAIKEIYNNLKNDIVSGRHSIEETLFRKHIDQLDNKINIIPRFLQVPMIQGVRGWNNSNY